MDSQTYFICSFCGQISRCFRQHVDHFAIHRHVTKKIICGYMKCKSALPSEASFRAHVIRVHKNRISEEQSTSPMNSNGQYQCPVGFCGQLFFHSRLLNNHIKLHLKAGIPSPCLFPACTGTFSSWNSLTGHMSKNHKKSTPDQQFISSESIPSETVSNATIFENDFHVSCTEVFAEKPVNTSETKINAQESLTTLAQFYQRLTYQHLVPQSTVQIVAEELETLVSQNERIILNSISNSLQNSDIPADIIDSALQTATHENCFKQAFHDLRTDHMRKKNFERLFSFVEPKRVDLGNGKFFYLVPISENLQECVKNKDWTEYFEKCSDSNGDVLCDFFDGTAFKNNKFFQENPNAIKLILYQDAFELVVPIGAAKNCRHNVIGVYMAIGNLPPDIRFQKESIQLVALCIKEDFDREKVYGRIVHDLLNVQKSGCEVPNTGNVKVGVVCVCGDNLGSHQLGGFLENFSRAIYFCRFCLLKRVSFLKNGGEVRTFKSRTVESYEDAISNLNNSNPKKKSCFGVKVDSEFNRLEGFHVIDGLPPCLGHDLFEGVVAHDMVLFIKYFIDKKWFTLDILNSRIDAFPYSVEDRRDKPVKIKNIAKQKLVGGAWQIRTFLRLFPLMIFDYVNDANDPVWLCLLNLIDIVDIVVAPEIHVSHLPALQCLVEEYLISRRELFPTIRLRAKHHFTLHYADLILKFGPLMKVWTMRFESKHTFFKRAWKNSKNSINILKTLSFKHEYLQSFVRSGGKRKLEVDSSDRFRFLPSTYSSAIVDAVCQVGQFTSFEECKYVSIKGTKYRKGHVVILKVSEFGNTLDVGTIFLILIDRQEKVNFLVKKGKAKLCFTNKSFKVTNLNSFLCIAVDDLLSYYPLKPYILNSTKYLCLKHALVNYDFK